MGELVSSFVDSLVDILDFARQAILTDLDKTGWFNRLVKMSCIKSGWSL
jgi:hypothetical protein